MTDNEQCFVDMIVNLEKHLAEACEYIKTNFDVDSRYDAKNMTLFLYVKNVDNAMQILAAREYLEINYPVLFSLLVSSCDGYRNE